MSIYYSFSFHSSISMGECNTIVSAYTKYIYNFGLKIHIISIDTVYLHPASVEINVARLHHVVLPTSICRTILYACISLHSYMQCFMKFKHIGYLWKELTGILTFISISCCIRFLWWNLLVCIRSLFTHAQRNHLSSFEIFSYHNKHNRKIKKILVSDKFFLLPIISLHRTFQ